MNYQKILALTICLGLTGPKILAQAESGEPNNQTIPVIGVEDDGTPVEVPVKVPFFKKRLKKAFKGINGMMLPSLNQQIPSDQPWYLSKMEIGVGLAASIGLGSVVKAKAEPTLLFIYKNLQAKKSRGAK